MSSFSKKEAGFTLIEIVVAFAIAATALALLFNIQSNAAATVALATEYDYATTLAKSSLAEEALTETHLNFTRSGTAGAGYQWTVRGEEYRSPAEPVSSDVRTLRLRALDVVVSWSSRGKQHRIELHTLKPFFGDSTP